MIALTAWLKVLLLPSEKEASWAGQVSLLFDLVATGIHRQLLYVSCNFTLALGIATQSNTSSCPYSSLPLLCWYGSMQPCNQTKPSDFKKDFFFSFLDVFCRLSFQPRSVTLSGSLLRRLCGCAGRGGSKEPGAKKRKNRLLLLEEILVYASLKRLRNL